MSSELISQYVLPTSEPIYTPTELPPILTELRSTQPPDPPALPTSQCTLSSLGTSATPFGIPSSIQDTLPPYNGLGTSILEPKSPSPSSPSSMSASNGEPTKSSSPGGGISTPPITTGPVGGTPFQNSSPMFGPTTSDICPSTSISSGVSPSPSSNGLAPGTPSITTSVPLQLPTKLPVTSIPPVLLGQQTPSQSPSVMIPSTTSDSMTTTSTSPYITATEPVSTGSSDSSSLSASTYPVTSTSSTSFQNNSHSQGIPTSVASSSQSVFSSTLSSTNIPNPVKSSTTTSSSTGSITYTSLSSKGPSPTNASAPTSTTSSSSQEETISSVLSNSSQNSQNSAKSSATTSNSSVPTGSSSSTSKSSKQNGPQTTAITSTSTSSSQKRPISSLLSSTVSKTDTQNLVKISTTSSTVPTDSTTYTHNSSKQNTQSTALASASVLTSSFHGGSTTSMSSGEVSPASSSSTENSLPTSSPDKVPTMPGPTNSPNTTSSLTEAAGYPTTISGADMPNSRSSSENIPSVTANALTTVTYSPGDSYTSPTAQPSDDLTESSSLTAHGTMGFVEHGPSSVVQPENVIVSTMSSTSTMVPEGESLSSFITTSTSFSYSTSIGASSTSVKTYTFTSTFITSTLIPTSGATTRSNEAAVIGGTIGGVLVVLVLSVAACCFVRRRRRSRYHQQLHDNDLTAPLSPETIEAMRGTHGEIMSESRDHASGSSVSSAFTFPRPAALRLTSEFYTRTSSGSIFRENISVSNDGYASSGEGSEGTERDFASAQSLYSSDGRESGENVDLGIAIRSESSMDLDSYCTAATTLAPLSHAPVDSDEDLESPGPSPSSFPIPPGSNRFLDMAQNTDYPEFRVSRVLHGMDAVLAATGSAAVTPTNFQAQQESWTAAVAAASSTDAETPEATRDLNPFAEGSYVIAVNDSPREDIKVPAQPTLATPLGNPSVIDIVNLFTPQEGLSGYSRNNEGHETCSISRVHFDPFESKDKGKAKAHLSADLTKDARRNRLSNASSGLEFPENASQCGIAL